ncbi:DNA helicase [Bacillus pseudomycoides]|nr:DNA helicase [Bacillus pseudomycoides]PED71293.1 DNA helicase [Bacillus pseudomycoides]PEI40616.1 DNA helicase [Bacillus pseudomycoides]PEJ79960.1 DNA helicase [Bacillus pseudomycoides]PEM08117.1 DNA helicase [Bacillus pseudomycoides]
MIIEQDADLIMLMYRDDYYDKETEYKDITEIQIAKHRNGPVGMMKLRFLKEYGKFVEGLKID